MLLRYLTIVLKKIISKTFGYTVIVTTGLIMCACSKDGNNQKTFLFLSFIITGCVTRQMSWHQIQKCTTVQKDFFPCGSMLYLYSLKALHKARPFTLFYAMNYCIRRDFHYTYKIFILCSSPLFIPYQIFELILFINDLVLVSWSICDLKPTLGNNATHSIEHVWLNCSILGGTKDTRI